jgi:hypothetical protein
LEQSGSGGEVRGRIARFLIRERPLGDRELAAVFAKSALDYALPEIRDR